MGHIIKFILIILLVSPMQAQTGVDFDFNNLARAKRTAAKENKIIFVDGYTTWCGPCKMMDAEVFANPKVAKFFNNSFVNLKMDLEDGEGVDFAVKYKTQAFPTFYFLSPEGVVLHQALGAFDAKALMEIAYDALREESQLLTYQQAYEGGRKDAEFLIDYAMLLKSLRLPDNAKLTRDYLNTQSDWSGEVNSKFIFDNVGIDLDDDLFKYMLANPNQFYDHIGRSKIDNKIINGIHGSLGPEGTPDEVEDKIRELLPNESQRIIDRMYLDNLMAQEQVEDVTIFANMAYFYVFQWKPTEWEFVNNLAWAIYEVGTTAEHFERGKLIALESVALDDNYFNNDTLGALCFMLKQKEEALKYANKAIRLAEEAGVSSASTQVLIQMIENLKD